MVETSGDASASAASAAPSVPAPIKTEPPKSPRTTKAARTPAASTAPAPGEMYYFSSWHCAVLFAVAFLLHLPILLDDCISQSYPVHKNGIVLLTGASSGIGKHAAIHLAKKNYTVFAGVQSKGDSDELAKAASEEGLKLTPIMLDVTKAATVNKAYEVVQKEVTKQGLPFAGLINDATVAQYLPLEFHDLKSIEELFAVNVFGVIRVTQKFLPLLRESNGRVINLSSTLGRLVVPEYTTYAASKHALEALSDGLRRELLALGVSVSVVEPGYVKSSVHAKLFEDGAKAPPAPEEAKKTYPHLYTQSRIENQLRRIKKGSPPSATTSAITDALTSRHPKARYPVAQVDDFPASLLLLLTSVLPDRLADRLILRP